MSFNITDPPLYVLKQIAKTTFANNLFENDRQLKAAIDVEHRFLTGEHDIGTVAKAVGSAHWNGVYLTTTGLVNINYIVRSSAGTYLVAFTTAFTTLDFHPMISADGILLAAAPTEHQSVARKTWYYSGTDKAKLVIQFTLLTSPPDSSVVPADPFNFSLAVFGV